MSTTDSRWSDLTTRIISAAALLAIAVGSASLGTWGFVAFVACVAACMGWELLRLHNPKIQQASLLVGALAAVGLVAGLILARLYGLWVAAILFALVALVAACLAGRERIFCGVYLFALLVAGFVVEVLFANGAGVLLLLLIGTVIVTDVAGYFAGKAIGGPKFWPRLSPKKTWAGIIAGWIAAAVLGYFVGRLGDAPGYFAGLAVAMSMGSQLGDIVESAMKRRGDVKDTSQLIPGHGGFLDRFDGLMGAALLTVPFLLVT